jgi:hypothetical protein
MAMINNYWTPEIWYVDEYHAHKDWVGWRSGTSLGFIEDISGSTLGWDNVCCH